LGADAAIAAHTLARFQPGCKHQQCTKKVSSLFNCQGLVYVSILDMGSCIQVAGSKIIQSRQARSYDLKQSFWSEGQCSLAVSDGMGDVIAPISPSTLGSVPTCPRPGKRWRQRQSHRSLLQLLGNGQCCVDLSLFTVARGVPIHSDASWRSLIQ
jgi:hypothetical protein